MVASAVQGSCRFPTAVPALHCQQLAHHHRRQEVADLPDATARASPDHRPAWTFHLFHLVTDPSQWTSLRDRTQRHYVLIKPEANRPETRPVHSRPGARADCLLAGIVHQQFIQKSERNPFKNPCCINDRLRRHHVTHWQPCRAFQQPFRGPGRVTLHSSCQLLCQDSSKLCSHGLGQARDDDVLIGPTQDEKKSRNLDLPWFSGLLWTA